MSFRLEVRDRASVEFIEAYLWYEQQRDGLGEEFHDEVQEHFEFLRQRPEGFAKWRRDRRCDGTGSCHFFAAIERSTAVPAGAL